MRELIEKIIALVLGSLRNPTTSTMVPTIPCGPPTMPANRWPADDRRLTQNITLRMMVTTTHAEILEENALVTDEEVRKLTETARLLETCFDIIGGPGDVHSGKRCPNLNKKVGGSETSQHLRCEAVDGSPEGPDTEASVSAAFEKLVAAARTGRLGNFGQLIFENERHRDGREGRAYWFHISLGMPYRRIERCREILTMRDGQYSLLERLPPLAGGGA